MRRAEQTEIEEVGQDSFLDVVSNIVGILILLVVIVGARAARHAGGDDPPAPPLVSADEVEAAAKQVLAQRTEIARKLQRTIAAVEEAELRDEERLSVTTFVTQLEQELQAEKEKLSTQEQRDLELRTQLAESQAKLEELTRQQVSIAPEDSAPQTLECLPTPFARAAEGEKAYLRIKGGRIQPVPMPELEALLIDRLRGAAAQLRDRGRVDGVVGPVKGFRLRFLVERVSSTDPSGGVSNQIRGPIFYLVPPADVVGETIVEALQPHSDVMAYVARQKRVGTTFLVWTYADSFGELSELEQALHERGFPVAKWLLAPQARIGFSPNGRKAVVQ
jgi:hypothetical protein